VGEEMKRPALQYPWVRILWWDITGLSAWGPPSEIASAQAFSEGWLIWQDATFVVVSNCVCGGEFGNRDKIPKGCIIEIDYGRKVRHMSTSPEVSTQAKDGKEAGREPS